MSVSPRQLFLIDGVGAIASAVLLGFMLVSFEAFFGIPSSTLYLLASLPLLFAAYDFYCYFFVERELAKYIVIIAKANLYYCLLSLGLGFYHYDDVTLYGWVYLIGEVIVVVALARWELRTAGRFINSPPG